MEDEMVAAAAVAATEVLAAACAEEVPAGVEVEADHEDDDEEEDDDGAEHDLPAQGVASAFVLVGEVISRLVGHGGRGWLRFE